LVLSVDEGVEAESEGVQTALEGTENVFTAVQVVGCEGDESALGEAEGECFVGAPCSAGLVGIEQVFWEPFEAVLAYDDGASF
jgi:hypothetical protein